MDLELAKMVGIVAAHNGGEILRSHFGKIAKIDKKEILTINGKIHKEMLSLMELNDI